MIFKCIPKRELTMRPGILFLAVVWLFLSAFILLGCEAQEKENTTPYKVVDSGMWVWDPILPEPWWLDNDRVLFPSNEKLQPGGGPRTMMIWNVVTGQAIPSQLSSVICARKGLVFFGIRDPLTNRVKYYRGPFENPQDRNILP